MRWTQVSPIFAAIDDEARSISLDIESDSTATYRCIATIEHMTGIEVEYDGPLININKNRKLLPNRFSLYVTYLLWFSSSHSR